MHGDRHLTLGAGLGCFVAQHAGSPELAAATIGTTAIAALLPDLDIESSVASYYGSKLVSPVALGASAWAGLIVGTHTGSAVVALTVGIGLAVAGLGVLRLLAPHRLFRHRDLLHTPFVGLMLTCVGVAGLLVLQMPQHDALLIGWAFLLGWLSHLAADSLTIFGLPLGKPFFQAPSHEHRYTTFDSDGRRTPHRYQCRLFHLTPRWLRFRSGSPVEWLLALPVLIAGLGVLLA